MNKKKKDINFTRLDCTIPVDLKKRLIGYASDMGLNLKSALIVILNEKLK